MLDFIPLGPAVGAEVRGIYLHQDLSEKVVKKPHEDWTTHEVFYFGIGRRLRGLLFGPGK